MTDTQSRRIFVTGGTGFTGSHLVKRLLSKGHEVVVLDNSKGLAFDELEKAGAQITLGSVTDRELVERLTAGCDTVLHVAAAFRKINVSQEVYWETNVNGTRYALEAAQLHGVRRFVYCSTIGVHGHVDNPPANEDSPIEPEDYYQYSKYEGEKVVRDFAKDGLETCILRPSAIYGPGDPERWMMLFRRVAPGWFPMFGDGKTTYHPLYIDNLVDAFELAMERDEAVGETFIIADEKYYTLNELVYATADVLGVDVKIVHLPFWPLWSAALACETVCKPLKISPPLFRRRVDWFRQVRAFDISKARQKLGYQPKVDLQTGLSETGKWYRQEGYL